MAYRRKYGNPRSSSTPDELRSQSEFHAADEYLSRPYLTDHSIQASSGNRNSSLTTAYGNSTFPPSKDSGEGTTRRSSAAQFIASNSDVHQYTSMKSSDQSKYGFWDVVTQKARSVLEDDNAFQQRQNSARTQDLQLPDQHRKNESPKFQKGLSAITSSLSFVGGKVGNALEEGFLVVENQTSDIIQETRKLNIRRKVRSSNVCNQTAYSYAQKTSYVDHAQTSQEIQLKAARDVANAMAAKAKLLMRELKTAKSDLTFAKNRCSQLEEENKFLREMRESRVHPEDDDLIRLQLETLLAEKARLAHENSVHARENRFLREIVEYHQLTSQDVVYLDEDIEEVSEVYSISGPNSYSALGTRNPWLVSAPNHSSCTSLPVPVPPLSASKTSTLPVPEV